jgi:two-component system phosphate regulon sensor histidine kinase PhoR
VHLVLDLPRDLPHVEADSERIQQVVVNLVHNAVKFTPPGGQVTVSAYEGDGEVAVVVADTGTGIAEEALPRLFERFYKVDRARSGGGTGLGLAIAKHLVQGHSGRIWAESAGEGRGATFTFTVPTSPITIRT